MRRLVLSIAVFLAHPFGSRADAAALTGRDELQDAYGSQLSNSPSLFDSAPIYHIIPTENTITFAGEYKLIDATIAPPGTDISANREHLTERLDLSGWTASPYVAFSRRTFGFGFSGETGKRAAHYLRTHTDNSGYQEHLGTLTYSGIGLNVFWTPKVSALPKYAQATLIAGAKSLNAVEISSGDLSDRFSPVTLTKYQYSVKSYDGGCNVSVNLVKRFTVIPWIDYATNAFDTPAPATGATKSTTNDQTVTDDARLFWDSDPSLRYGIDFAVDIFGVNLHIGGLIGILGTLNKGSDRIYDGSHALSLSFDTKGGK